MARDPALVDTRQGTHRVWIGRRRYSHLVPFGRVPDGSDADIGRAVRCPPQALPGRRRSHALSTERRFGGVGRVRAEHAIAGTGCRSGGHRRVVPRRRCRRARLDRVGHRPRLARLTLQCWPKWTRLFSGRRRGDGLGGMDLIKPDDARYDEARTVFNAMIDKRPAVIAQCAIAGRRRRGARARRATRATTSRCAPAGTRWPACASTTAGIVIDVRPMKQIEVDPDARQVRVGAGVTWGEFDRATQEHGLATTGGRVSTTGVAGLTLGGGSGWLERAYGLALRQPRLGRPRHRRRPRGHRERGREPRPVLGAARRRRQLRRRDVVRVRAAPGRPDRDRRADALARRRRRRRRPALPRPRRRRARRARHRRSCSSPARPRSSCPRTCRARRSSASPALWAGDVDEGAEAVAPFRELAPEVDLVGPMPYADFQCMIDDPPGMRQLLVGRLPRRRSPTTRSTCS